MDILNRKFKPPLKDEITFKLPKIERFSLPNGLKVYFIKKNKLPIVQLNFLFNAGSKYDPADKKGLANILAMAIDEGAGPYNSLRLSDEFDKLGTHFNVHASEDNIFFSVQSLSENFKRSAELVAYILKEPHLSEKDFEREKRKIITRIIQLKDEADEIADIVFERVLFGNNNPYAYPVYGYKESLEALRIDDVRNFYSGRIIPDGGAIVAVGNISLNELKENLTALFSDWKPGTGSSENSFKNEENKYQFCICDKKDAVQSEIRIGHTASKRNEKDYYSKTLVNMILGGQFTSRINLNLREKNGYTYGATSRFNYFQEDAFFSVSTSVNSDNTVPAVKEIINELKGIKGGIKEEELEFAKSSLIRKFPSNFETYRQIASNLSAAVIHALPDDYFNNYIQNIKSVQIDEMNEISMASINPEKVSIVVVGDKKKLKPQLDEIAGGKVIETDLNGQIVGI